MSKRKVTEIAVNGTYANAGFDRTFYFDKVCANLGDREKVKGFFFRISICKKPRNI